MNVYYNEIEPFAVAWLRNLIAGGHLPAGEIDTRPIQEVTADDLQAYTQCHFFAGIGGWAYALDLARWPRDRFVWTGSCPCQPFSVAGKGAGGADARHLWPHWYRLIRECRPPVVFGEQVAGAIRHGWLDLVSGDLEAEGYAVGSTVLGAHSVGAPHIRQRLWFVGHAGGQSSQFDARELPASQARIGGTGIVDGYLLERLANASAGIPRLVADADGGERGRRSVAAGGDNADGPDAGRSQGDGRAPADSATRELADAGRDERAGRGELREAGGGSGGSPQPGCGEGLSLRPGADARDGGSSSGAWSDLDWLPCRDGKWRPTEPSIFPLADGLPGRVGQLRAAGNAIVPHVAAAFVEAYLATETQP